jgi:poly(A) polymerase
MPESESDSSKKAMDLTPDRSSDLIPVRLLDFQSRSVYPCCDSRGHKIAIDSLSIATFNALCDWHTSDRIQTEKRLPEIARHLHVCQADIIAIQEATPILLEHLLMQDWIQEYCISEELPGESLKPYGVLLLSRFPFTLVEHSFSTHKRVLVGTWKLDDRDLHVATLHLPSDFADYAREQRHSQLKKVLTYLNTLPGDSILAGDFNTRGDDLDEVVTQLGWFDVWQKLHPNEPGYTFDPPRNPLAASNSRSGRGARFDRILRRNQDSVWPPRRIELFACEPVPGTGGQLYPSDHFGLRAIFKKTNLNPTYD